MRTVITNGRIITATDDFQGDILIDGEQIVAIYSPGTFATMQSDSVLDAQGKYVFPGAIDVHTHMELPLPTTVASDNFETGTIAAAGGISPYTYSKDGITFQASGTFSSLAAGSYTITVKDNNGCTTTRAVTITQPASALNSSIT